MDSEKEESFIILARRHSGCSRRLGLKFSAQVGSTENKLEMPSTSLHFTLQSPPPDASSNKFTPPKLPQRAPPTDDQEFKYQRLWGRGGDTNLNHLKFLVFCF